MKGYEPPSLSSEGPSREENVAEAKRREPSEAEQVAEVKNTGVIRVWGTTSGMAFRVGI